MRIKVEHIQNTFNYGSLMITVNTLDYSYKNLGEVTFYVDCNTEEDLKRLKIETGIKDIYS